MSKLERYSSYRDSGVEWIGKIPSDWKAIPLKACTEIKSIKNASNLELLSVYLELGVIRFKDITQKRTNVTSTDLSDYQIVNPGDLVLNNQQAWRGSVGVSKYKGIVSPAYIVLKLSELFNSDFANFYFRTGLVVSQYLINSRGVGTIQRNLYWAHLKQTYICIPPIDEQIKIASFLNTKTEQLDKAIKQKEQLIEQLKERRQILINDAVTKGLDKTVDMKDSGVEWIGKIPEHWEVKKLRYIGNTQNGISAGAEYFGSGFPFINYGDVYKNIELPKVVSGLANSSKEDRNTYSILKGDVFFTRTSETAIEIGFSSTCTETFNNAIFSGFLIRFRPNKKLYEGYSKFYFRSSIHRAYFVKEMNLVIRASLSQELLKNLPVILPPRDEQIKISNYIEKNNWKIDKAINLQQQQITKLKEYKTTLIDSVVTGKVRV